MPTGYTAKLSDGDQPFEEFVWSCARAFGALVMMRDDPQDKPVPKEFEPAPYYFEWLNASRAKLAEWEGSNEETRRAIYATEIASAQRSHEELQARSEGRRQRYEAMVARVEAWEPPSPDHAGMRRFMLEQLNESIRFDCYEHTAPEVRPFEEWEHDYSAKLHKEVARNERSLAEEKERVATRNRWIAQLRESVPQPNPEEI